MIKVSYKQRLAEVTLYDAERTTTVTRIVPIVKGGEVSKATMAKALIKDGVDMERYTVVACAELERITRTVEFDVNSDGTITGRVCGTAETFVDTDTM